MLELRLVTGKRGARLGVSGASLRLMLGVSGFTAPQMSRAIDAKGGERCAAIVGAKQKSHDPPPSRPSN